MGLGGREGREREPKIALNKGLKSLSGAPSPSLPLPPSPHDILTFVFLALPRWAVLAVLGVNKRRPPGDLWAQAAWSRALGQEGGRHLADERPAYRCYLRVHAGDLFACLFGWYYLCCLAGCLIGWLVAWFGLSWSGLFFLVWLSSSLTGLCFPAIV